MHHGMPRQPPGPSWRWLLGGARAFITMYMQETSLKEPASSVDPLGRSPLTTSVCLTQGPDPLLSFTGPARLGA